MLNINEIKGPLQNKNLFKLSKDAINFLDNQLIKDCESLEIEVDFTFQIIYAIKKIHNWYCCSLMDQKSKFGGFCIKYNKRYGEPKEGDIINIKKIKIVKLPNRDENLYFCDKVKKIQESKKMIINPKSVESISQVRSTSKKKTYMKYRLFQNYNEEDNKDIVFNSPVQERLISNLNNNLLGNNPKVNSSPKKPTLISEFTSFVNNPLFILKCLYKSEIKTFISKYNKGETGCVQNYLFSDVNGDKIQAVTYSLDNIKKFDEILKIDSIYEITKTNPKMNFNKGYALANHNIQLQFMCYTKIEELTEEKKKLYEFKDKVEFSKIKEILNCDNKIFNVYAIVLEDKGIIEKKKSTNNDPVKYRRLIIADDSLYKVSLKLWDNLTQPNKTFIKGDIICNKDVKYRQWNNYYELYSLLISKIEYADNTERGKALKKFYYNHQRNEDYKDLNFVELDNKKDIQQKFIDDFLDEFRKESKQIYFSLYKINGIVTNIEHKDENVFSGCKFCCKRFEDICPTCNSYHKKLYFDFRIKIKDCSNFLWIHFFGENAENFLGITPEEYQLLIKYNNKYKLDEINKKIIYHEYTFIGKYVNPNSDELKREGFLVILFKKSDNEYYKKLINEIKNES